MNSPWAIMATCMNCSLLRPTISTSFSSVSFWFWEYSRPSGRTRDTVSRSSVKPVPRRTGRRCRGERRTVYTWSASKKVSSTKGVRDGSANWLCSSAPSFLFAPELASPYRANTMASNSVVLPAPVSPVIRNRFWLGWVKSTEVFAA